MISQVSTHYCYPLTSGPSWWCPTRVCTLQWYNNPNQPLSGPSTWLRLCHPSKHSLTFAAMQQSSVEKVQLVEWMVVGLTRVNSSTKELVIIIIIITVMPWWLLIRRLSMMHIKEKPFNTFIGHVPIWYPPLSHNIKNNALYSWRVYSPTCQTSLSPRHCVWHLASVLILVEYIGDHQETAMFAYKFIIAILIRWEYGI